jgi:hypothetical protein
MLGRCHWHTGSLALAVTTQAHVLQLVQKSLDLGVSPMQAMVVQLVDKSLALAVRPASAFYFQDLSEHLPRLHLACFHQDALGWFRQCQEPLVRSCDMQGKSMPITCCHTARQLRVNFCGTTATDCGTGGVSIMISPGLA